MCCSRVRAAVRANPARGLHGSDCRSFHFIFLPVAVRPASLYRFLSSFSIPSILPQHSDGFTLGGFRSGWRCLAQARRPVPLPGCSL